MWPLDYPAQRLKPYSKNSWLLHRKLNKTQFLQVYGAGSHIPTFREEDFTGLGPHASGVQTAVINSQSKFVLYNSAQWSNQSADRNSSAIGALRPSRCAVLAS